MSSRLNHLSETSLYVEDLDRSRHFYEHLFGLKPVLEADGIVGLELPGSAVLLLVCRDAVTHHAESARHLCLAIPTDSIKEWERHLMMNGVIIESRVVQPTGGTSLYFRDPDQHSLEVATAGA